MSNGNKNALREYIDSLDRNTTTAWIVFFISLILILIIHIWIDSIALWVINTVLLLLIMISLGQIGTGRARGLLLDERNKFSLSRFQFIIWTLLVISVYITAAEINLGIDPSADPLVIAIPPELLTLMGLSVGSLVLSPAFKGPNKGREPSANVETKHDPKFGLYAYNENNNNAEWGDLVKGEEWGNNDQLDLARIQLLFFTFIVIFAYVMTLARLINSGSAIDALPELDFSIVPLIGISQGGYLAKKLVTHTPIEK